MGERMNQVCVRHFNNNGAEMSPLRPRREGKRGKCASVTVGLLPLVMSTTAREACRMARLVRHLRAQVPLILLSFRDILIRRSLSCKSPVIQLR